MTRIIVALAVTSLLCGMSPARHEFYVTITELNKVRDTLQVSIRIFTDDLEHTLGDETGKKVFLQPGAMHDEAFKTITAYLDKHFKVSSASNTYRLKWLGHEYADDVTWIHAETVLDPEVNILFVENTLLIHHFSGQQNLVHFRTENGYDSRVCTKDAPEARFVLVP